MTEREQREAARQFYNKWRGRGQEDEDDETFWLDLMTRVLGIEDASDRIQFQKKLVIRGNTKRIDAYIPETGVLIEQKSLGVNLDKAYRQSDGEMRTPFEQAKNYKDNLTSDHHVNWIVVSNFREIRIHDLRKSEPEKNFTVVLLEDIQDKYSLFEFLTKKAERLPSEEVKVSKDAGTLVGRIYDALLEQYADPTNPESLKSLNALCVRLVFCLYAEDAGVFGRRRMFYDYLKRFEARDLRGALISLFTVLDEKPEERDPYLDEELAAFPYVNGGLFTDKRIEIPRLTDGIKELILTDASENFDWSVISPTIFGAVFESTLNPETRHSGGMHYTSIENIHKVIDPLFLDDLKDELTRIKGMTVLRDRRKALKSFQNKIASLTFLDPACGSGNFLTETYLSLRRLENESIALLEDGQMVLEFSDPIKVSINQFYGIEINDFAVTVAKTALWIAESQMMKETEDIVHADLDFLPLTTNAHIVEGNAVRIDWEDVVPKESLSYIIGNPPFLGARVMGKEQKEDVNLVFNGWKSAGNLDYVSCWYKKAADFMHGTSIRAALVSTNSLSQGDSVATLWKPLFKQGIHIDFAHTTFRWDSESTDKAHVHCVIVGFSEAPYNKEKVIYTKDEAHPAKHINAYLLDADDVFIESRSKPLSDVPQIGIGNKPIDDGNYLFTETDMKTFIEKEPASGKYFHPWYGSYEFINRKPRYCLWLGDCTPAELRAMPECMKRIEAVRKFRLSSKSPGTVKLAERPTHFHVENMPKGNFIVIPEVSSEKRRYVPIGFMTPDVMCSNLVKIMPDATLYHFGVLTSNVHMSWMRAVCGRLETRYRYSKDIVYNNFPWPDPSPEQRERIEKTARGILDARELYPDSSFADLYHMDTMPPELKKAHNANNIAVMKAYGFSVGDMSEEACVAALMELYKGLSSY